MSVDTLARHRLLMLAGIEVRAVPPVVEDLEDELDDEEFEDDGDGESDDEFDDVGEDEEDEEELDDEDQDEEEDEDDLDEEDEPDDSALTRHRQLQMLGVEVRQVLRQPKGAVGGGRFRAATDSIVMALKKWADGDGPDDPFEGFSREQLKTAAVSQGITVRPRAPLAEIKRQLIYKTQADSKTKREAAKAAPDAPAPKKSRKPTREQVDQALQNLDTATGDSLKARAKLFGVDPDGSDSDVRDRIRAAATEQLTGSPRKRAPRVTGPTKTNQDLLDAEAADTARREKVTADVVDALQDAKSRAEVQEILDGLTTPDLKLVAAKVDSGIPAGPSATKAQLSRDIGTAALTSTGHMKRPRQSRQGELEAGQSDAPTPRKSTPAKASTPKAATKVAKSTPAEVIASTGDALAQLERDLRKVPEGRRKSDLGGKSPADIIKAYRERLASGELKPDQVGGLLRRLLFQNSDRGGKPDNTELILTGKETLRDPRLGQAIQKAIDDLRAGQPTPRAATKVAAAKAPKAAPADVVAKLNSAQTRDEAHELLKGKTRDELVKIANAAKVAIGSKYTKQKIADELVRWTVGRRLESDAITGARSGLGTLPPRSPGSVNRIRDAYNAAPKSDTGFVSLADIRDQLGDMPRAEQDAALRQLATTPGVELIPVANSKSIAPRFGADPRVRDAAITIGGEEQHAIRFAGSTTRSADFDEGGEMRSAEARDRMLRLAGIETRAFVEEDHPRGTGDKGGEFVKKDEGATGSNTKVGQGHRPMKGQKKPPAKQEQKQQQKQTQESGQKRRQGAKSAGKSDDDYISKPEKPKGPLKIGGDNDPAQVKELQALLRSLGLSTQSVSGTFDRATENAVKQAQIKLGLKPTGRASAALVKKMLAAHALSPCAKGGKRDVGHEFFELRRALIAGDLEEDSLADFIGELRDANPANNQLKHYWTRGEGLAKWRTKPHPWTALRNHLLKHVGPGRAERMASDWFHEVFGYWPGHRKGANPVGPG